MVVDFVGGGDATWWIWGPRSQTESWYGVDRGPKLALLCGKEGGLFPGYGIALLIAFRR